MGYMTEERRLIQETARAFAMKEVLPLANKLDPEKGDMPPELIQKLREAGRNDIKVIAGGVIPPQDYEYLRDACVQGIYGPGSNVVECAADVLRLLGHNQPPAEMATTMLDIKG